MMFSGIAIVGVVVIIIAVVGIIAFAIHKGH